jgi:hypothetical protein
VKLPKLSIAARLYAIFALMAATTVALSVAAVSNARFHAALTEEFEFANAGSWNVERINGLIYATVMETRGIYMSADAADAGKYADSLLKATDQISAVTCDWQRSVRNSDALAFSNLAVRLNDYQDSLYKLAPIVSRGPRPRANGPPKTSRPKFAMPSARIWRHSASITLTPPAEFTRVSIRALTIRRYC